MLKKIITFLITIALLGLIIFIFVDTKRVYQNKYSIETQKFIYDKTSEYQDEISNLKSKKLQAKELKKLNNNSLNSVIQTNNNTNNNFTQNLGILAVPKEDVYVIKPGDTLISIANIHNKDYRKLGKLNNIKNLNLIYAWNTLKLSK